MPGHYVQAEFANEVQPKTRRVLRRCVAMARTWKVGRIYHADDVDEGFLDHSPELRLTLDEQELRVLANAIIDIRLQTGTHDREQAMELMEKDTFQEAEEANGKVQRARKLSSAQLPMYYRMATARLTSAEHSKRSLGEKFNFRRFHDRALKEGALPLPVLGNVFVEQWGSGGRSGTRTPDPFLVREVL